MFNATNILRKQPLVSLGGRLTLLIIPLIFLVGCDPVLLQAQLQEMAREQQASLAETRSAGNQLLVIGFDGNLYTMDPDGSNRLALTDDASSNLQYMQPTWSPEGDMLVWSQVENRDGSMVSSITTSMFNGQAQSSYEVPFPPFYYYWSPDSEHVAYLSNWISSGRSSIALRLLDVIAEAAKVDSDDETIVTLGEGQPFYFSWAPDGQQLLTHIGNERLEVQSLDGSQESLWLDSATFPAPRWASSGDSFFYAVNEGDLQLLVNTDLAGDTLFEVTDFEDRITFIVSPDDSKLAYVITEGEMNAPAFGSLYVVDMESKRTREINETPVFAFFWSPDSKKLAYLAVDTDAGSLSLRWHVWNSEENALQEYDLMLPTRTFWQSYLNFFDQFAQSMTIWSPDSDAFTYAGRSEDDGMGIWVQQLDGEEPEFVGRGVYSAWSPK